MWAYCLCRKKFIMGKTQDLGTGSIPKLFTQLAIPAVAAQIINLLKELRDKRNLAILFISHDMNVIRYLADRVGIMQLGSLVEENYTSTLFKYPKEEYTKKLLDAVPVLKQ